MVQKLHYTIILCLFATFSGNLAYSCSVSPSFTYSNTHTCGLPNIVKAMNTSSGTYSNIVQYWWKVDNKNASDTIVGLDSIQLLLKKIGTNRIKLYVKDSTGCIDSSSAVNITVSSNAKTILDQNNVYSLNPSWTNCIQFITDPDTFGVNFESADTLKSLKLFWGDGSSDVSSGNLAPNTVKSHLYTSLGIFTIKIVTTNGACIDTVYGTVYSQRQPTAGIIGPPSGSNRGCVPHTLRIVNNSYNISDNTTFEINWGIGPTDILPSTSYQDTLYHTYTQGICSGVITITARNVCGNSFTTWNPIDISDRDLARWAVTKTCVPTQDHVFQNLSTDRYCLTPDIKEYFWDFGDGTTIGWTNSKASQVHKFKTEGDYIITLIAKSTCGNDTFKDMLQVFYNPVAAYKLSSDRGCNPLTVSLTDTSKGRGISRLWTITEGVTVATFTDSILNYTFTRPGTNTVSLRVSNPCGTSTLSRPIIVDDKPTASFANISSTCIPILVNFNNTSTSYFASATYSWDFGDSTYSNLENPSPKTYTVAGTYKVILIVSDSCGNDTFSQTFTAYGLPLAILPGDTAACSFDSLSFNNLSTNSNTFNWDFGDSQTLTTAQTGITKHLYTIAGNYSVRLIAGTGSGCKDTTYLAVHIKPGAKAQFTIDKSYGCNPTTFKFTNNSIYGQDFSWYANDVLISTNSSLTDSVIYTDSTVVNLKLVVTSASSCQGDSFAQIFFTPKNPEAIIANQDSGCGILNVQFNNQSTNSVSHSWDLGNGQTSTLVNPIAYYISALGNDTFYYPELKVTNWAGCRDSVKTIIKVYPGPRAIFSMDKNNGCGPLTITFTNLSKTNNTDPFNSLNHQWNFGDGSQSTSADPSHAFSPDASKDTIYQISLRTTTINGCYDSTFQMVRVYPIPTVQFSPDKTSGCAILPVNFTNFSNPGDTGSIAIMSFSWNSGNGKTSTGRDFSANYNGSKTSDTLFNVTLTGYSEHGCIDSTTMHITVHPQPIAKFSLNTNSGCTPLFISTQNQSQSMDGGPLTHNWDFDNTYKSSKSDDSTWYMNNTNGDLLFNIVYEAISQYGCRDTANLGITVRPKPVAKFTASTKKACAPAVIKVTDNSINASKYYWGEGTNTFKDSIIENITLPGLQLFDTLYFLAHQVTSPYGCKSDTVYEQILVMARPLAEFEYTGDSLCAGVNISLVNNSLGGYRYLWKFGDQTTSNLINPKHKFPVVKGTGRDSVFNVSLEVTSAAGCKDTILHPIYLVNKATDKIVLDKPVGCTDLQVALSHSSHTFKLLYWDFGDYTAHGYTDSILHTYNNPLSNLAIQPEIALYRQRYNCFDTTFTNVLVYPKPKADFITLRNDPCDAGIYQIINKSKNNTGNEWTIDNLIYSVSSFSIILPSAEYRDTFYNVKLIVTNNYLCQDSTEQLIKVKPKLQIKFDQQGPISCEKGTVNFTNKSVNSVRYFWKFGDGGVSNEDNPSYVYNHYGFYKIMLYGYDKDGCVDSSDGTASYKVLEKPKADFSYLPILPKLPNALVNFTAKPTIVTVNEDDLIYEWDFGDNSFPTANKNIKNPSHIYTSSGFMNVRLTIWNEQCSDLIIKPIYIEDPKPVVDFMTDTVAGCAPFTVKFRNQTTNVTSYRWIFGDGSPDAYDMEPTHTYQYEGQWDVTLIATGTGGTTTLTRKSMVTTYPKPFVDFYSNKQFLSLPNAIFNLQNISNTVKNDWNLYDSIGNIIQSSTMRDPSFYVNQSGKLTVRLIGTNSYGCVDTMIKSNYLTTLTQGYVYVPNAFSPNKNGRNDEFKPSVYNVRSGNYVFRIYNRWGEKLFETIDMNATWDGMFKGEPCEQDIYIWSVNGEYINADLFAFRGTVTLLR